MLLEKKQGKSQTLKYITLLVSGMKPGKTRSGVTTGIARKAAGIKKRAAPAVLPRKLAQKKAPAKTSTISTKATISSKATISTKATISSKATISAKATINSKATKNLQSKPKPAQVKPKTKVYDI